MCSGVFPLCSGTQSVMCSPGHPCKGFRDTHSLEAKMKQDHGTHKRLADHERDWGWCAVCGRAQPLRLDGHPMKHYTPESMPFACGGHKVAKR